jgi:hypothetical protein
MEQNSFVYCVFGGCQAESRINRLAGELVRREMPWASAQNAANKFAG